MSKEQNDRYAFKNAGPAVSQKGPRLAGKTFNTQPSRSPAPVIARGPPVIETNVDSGRGGSGPEASVSDITSAADQFNNYRFNETAATNTYKKMMTIHLKDDMFGRLKFITKGEDMQFSRNTSTICSYVCTKMRVPDYQWGEYWDLVKQTTKKMIEQQRTNASSKVRQKRDKNVCIKSITQLTVPYVLLCRYLGPH
jgi:hypothetical protein